jgi:hypothetical protein
MRVTFNVEEPKEIRDFFSGGSTYLDIMVFRHAVYIVSSNGIDLYSHMSFGVVSLEDFKESVYIRFNRKSFIALLRVGHVSILVDNELDVEVGFNSDGYNVNVTRPLQKSDIKSLMKFFEISEKFSEGMKMDLTPLQGYTSLLKGLNSVITATDSVIYASFGSAGENTSEVQLYIEKSLGVLCLHPSTLFFIADRSEEISKFREFLIGRSGRSVVVVQNLNTRSLIDFDWLQGMMKKRSHLAEVNLSSVCDLAISCELDGTVVIDIDAETATFTKSSGRSRETYKTSFKVSRRNSKAEVRANRILASEDPDFESLMSTSMSADFPRLRLPTPLLKKSLNTLARGDITISICKSIVVFESKSGVYLVIGRSDA